MGCIAALVLSACTSTPPRPPVNYVGITLPDNRPIHLFCDTVDRGRWPVCNGVSTKTPVDDIPPAPAVDVSKILQNEPIAVVNFDFDKSNLKADAMQILDALAGNPAYTGKKLYLRGYTDSIGRELYNTHLATSRATSVKNYLIRKGLNRDTQLVALGYGLCCYVVDNSTAEGREKNRRVEIYAGD